MADKNSSPGPTGLPGYDKIPDLETLQRWTRSIGQAQQALIEHAVANMGKAATPDTVAKAFSSPVTQLPLDVGRLGQLQADLVKDSVALWQHFLQSAGGAVAPDAPVPAVPAAAERNADPRAADPAWASHPAFDFIRQSYNLMADYMLRATETIELEDPLQRQKLRFATQRLIEATSPVNTPFTNPLVMEKTIESGGENLVRGLEHMLRDVAAGQLRQTDTDAFQIGVNIAATPGKVVHETPLYQLIQYTPTTKKVLETPVVIFPAWINRFYILDLGPEKSFVKWAVDQGITVFMVSWKSADASMKDVDWDDYILRGQIDAIDVVRDICDVPSVHAIGYCVAGTTLAATLALLAARGQADKVASATFFVAQVDFLEAGDLLVFIDDEQLKLVDQLSSPGYLDGRYMAAAFNMLRGRDLIWNYVVNNYLLGKDYVPFDLLYWNGDVTNLPLRFHKRYLTELYRDNKLATPGAVVIDGTPINLHDVVTPTYIQAAREDHIAPPRSVWKAMEHFSGPNRFLLAASGHIAGVVNPPQNNRYGYWTCDAEVSSLDDYLAHAQEHKGSWWPDWKEWLVALTPEKVAAKGTRIPGKGGKSAIEDAPGRYVRMR